MTRKREMPVPPGLLIPPGLDLLCQVLDVEVDQVLSDFMRALAGDHSHHSSKAADYFLSRHYERQGFSAAEIQAMLQELQSLSRLWPENAPEDLVEMHVHWRQQYLSWWCDKWSRRRKKPFPEN